MEKMPHRILVISPNWIGDAIMAQPLLTRLKTKWPEVVIDVLAPGWAAPVWQAMPEVGTVIPTTFKHGKLQFGERLKMAKKLRDEHYDAAYVLPNTIKYALIPWLARIPKRIGYLGEKRYGLLNVIHHDDKTHPRPMIPFYAALADAPSNTVGKREDYPVSAMFVHETEVNAAFEKFGLDRKKRLIAFAPGAEYGPAKRWPEGKFAQLAQMILQKYPDVQIVLMGSGNDKVVCDPIEEAVPGVVNLAGQTTLAEAIAIISQITLMVTNDSGLMHIASAFEKPLVAIYGSTDYTHTPPFSKYSEIISLNLPCAPCQKRECPLGHHNCMKQLNPDLVFPSVAKYL